MFQSSINCQPTKGTSSKGGLWEILVCSCHSYWMVGYHELCSPSGRAGYGASLDGMVSILYQPGDGPSMILFLPPLVALFLRYLWCGDIAQPDVPCDVHRCDNASRCNSERRSEIRWRIGERGLSNHMRDLSNLLNIKSFLPGQKLCKHPSNCKEFDWAHLRSTMYMPRRITPWTDACRRHLCRSCCTWNWCNWSYCYGWCRNGMSCLSCSYSLSHKLSRARFLHNLDHSMQVPI